MSTTVYNFYNSCYNTSDIDLKRWTALDKACMYHGAEFVIKKIKENMASNDVTTSDIAYAIKKHLRVSLRNYNYKMADDDVNRHYALTKATQAHGIDAVINRLDYLKDVNKKYSEQTARDMDFVTKAFANVTPVVIAAEEVPVSLRAFGYRMPNNDSSRHNALDEAVKARGYDSILERLVYLKQANKIYTEQTGRDVVYLKRAHGPNTLINQEIKTQTLATIGSVAKCMQTDEVELINYYNCILQDLVKILNKI